MPVTPIDPILSAAANAAESTEPLMSGETVRASEVDEVPVNEEDSQVDEVELAVGAAEVVKRDDD